MYRVAINGVIQEGIPTPRLIEEGGGKAYLKKGIWYFWVDGEYESEDGSYSIVSVVNVEA